MLTWKRVVPNTPILFFSVNNKCSLLETVYPCDKITDLTDEMTSIPFFSVLITVLFSRLPINAFFWNFGAAPDRRNALVNMPFVQNRVLIKSRAAMHININDE